VQRRPGRSRRAPRLSIAHIELRWRGSSGFGQTSARGPSSQGERVGTPDALAVDTIQAKGTKDMTTQQIEFVDVTSELHTVTGGGKLGTLWKGAKAVYETARPILKETAEVVKDLGVIGGVGYGAKRVWDEVTGRPPAQPQPGK
jgi:hypothetical protein